MASCIGSKVRITADDGVYSGIVDSVDLNHGRVTLKEVSAGDSSEIMCGKFHFFRTEIQKIDVLEDASSKPKVNPQVKNAREPKLMYKRLQPTHLRNLKELNMDKMLLKENNESATTGKISNHQANHQKSASLKKDSQQVSSSPSETSTDDPSIETSTSGQEKETLLSDFKLIEEIDSMFHQAISTQSHLMLFDMIKLGKAAIEEGIGQILQEPSILKVIHDCRRMSDMFYHQFGVKLVNVFDTQVADVMIYRFENNGRFPEYVNGLPACLFENLELDPEEVYIRTMREGSMAKDQSVWTKRPAPDDVLDALVKSCRCLLELRRVQLQKMLRNFTDGVDIYLSVIRDSLPSDNANKEVHLLPRAFQDLSSQAALSRQRTDELLAGSQFQQNCVGVYDPRMKFCHDSLWRAGDGVTVKTSKDRDAARESRAQQRSRNRSRSRSRSAGSKTSDNEGPKLLPKKEPPTPPLSSGTVPTLSVDLGNHEVITVKLPSDTESFSHNASPPNQSWKGITNKKKKEFTDSSDGVKALSQSNSPELKSRIILKAAGNEHLVAVPKEKLRRKCNLSCTNSSGSESDGKRNKDRGYSSDSRLPSKTWPPQSFPTSRDDTSSSDEETISRLSLNQSPVVETSPKADPSPVGRGLGRSVLLKSLLESNGPKSNKSNSLLQQANAVATSESEGQFANAAESGSSIASSAKSGSNSISKAMEEARDLTLTQRSRRAGLGRAAALARYDA